MMVPPLGNQGRDFFCADMLGRGGYLADFLAVRTGYQNNFKIPNAQTLQAMLLFGVSVLFGGGGSSAGILNLIVQLVSLAIIAVNRQAFFDFFRRSPRTLSVLVGVGLLLPLAQIIPLPPSIWHNLPGRDLVEGPLELLDQQAAWFPMSLNARRTLVAFFSLLPATAMLILAYDLPKFEEKKLLFSVVLAGIFVVLFGSLQLSTENRHFIIFPEVYRSNNLHATFANRNTTGIFLDVAMIALIGIFPKNCLKAASLAGFATGILLLIGIVLTRSRSSMVLTIVPFAFLVYRLSNAQIFQRVSLRLIAIAALGVALLGGSLALGNFDNSRIRLSLSRFDDLQNGRALIWTDAWQSTLRYWPVGSGIGTFDEVFQVDETLEALTPGRAARAHNDYLEVALESGFVGVLMLVGWAFLICKIALNALRTDASAATYVAVLTLLAFQSVLDYPLRNQTMLCVAALTLALLLTPRPTKNVG